MLGAAARGSPCHGCADREAHGNDGRTVLEVVAAARAEERNAKTLTALDAVAAALRAPGSGR